MSAKNDELLELSRTLNDVAAELHRKKADTDNTDEFVALNNELFEVNHRIAMVGGLIFTARAQDIADAVKKVEESREELARAIEQVEKVNQFITTISSFLGLVDDVIDLAKKV